MVGTVLLGVVAAGIVFSFFSLFSRFPFYDDEGKILLYTQHLLDGHALYDQIEFIYGPTFLLGQWLIFSALGIPLCNDAVRTVTVFTWCVTALMLAATAWNLARSTGWAIGLAAIVWVAGIFHLVVFTNEPGHPQQLVALLLASAFWITAAHWSRHTGITLTVLGAITGALIMTKINVGVLFGLALGISIVSLGSRPSFVWGLLRGTATLAVLALPTILMRSRFPDGFGLFCFTITAALFPCCWLALFAVQPGDVGLRHLLLCGLGAAVALSLTTGFAVAQGNTVAGMIRALVTLPMHGFAGAKYGGPLELPRLTAYWSLIGAGLGLGAFWVGSAQRRFLWPLRLFVCTLIFSDALVARSWDSQATWLSLPLIWLLLMPPVGYAPQANEWFFRLLLAFTACLQPIQVFPIPGSQIHIGTLTMVLAGVVLLRDLYHELQGADGLPVPATIIVRIAFSLLGVAALLLIFNTRGYEVLGETYSLPSLNTLWSLFGAAFGLIVLWSGSWPRGFPAAP